MQKWYDFLNEQGARWQDNKLIDFARATTSSHHKRMIPMVDHRLITAAGPDAQAFLQGQTTCDLRRLEQNDLLLGAHCNPKGRMISSFTVAQNATGTITLRLRASIAESALGALKKYIVFSKATLDEDERIGIALLGEPDSALGLPQPAEPGRTASADGLTVLRHPGDLWELWLSVDAARELWPQLRQSFNPCGTAELDRHFIQQGIAEVHSATQEAFIPQMFNLQLIDAISFKKGCYTGQEIVARMQYRGQVKKHTYRAVLEKPDDVEVGADIHDSTTKKSVGTIVGSACGVGFSELLIVTGANTYGTETEALTTDGQHKKVTWAELPYAIP